MKEIHALGHADIYLVDQLMKRRISEAAAVLDVGCGRGRNVEYLLRNGIEVWGIDRSTEAIEQTRRLARRSGRMDDDRFLVAEADVLPFPDARFDYVIANAVFHFAESPEHFRRMLTESHRVLRPEGHLFIRTATAEGLSDLQAIGNGRFLQPDGDERFLVSFAEAKTHTHALGASLADPLKTSLVEGKRSMMTWVLRA